MKIVTRSGDELRQIDRRDPAPPSGAILLLATVRNEQARLPYFLSYHRELGVDRFYVVDNDSTDGTTELLLSNPDVHVFHTSGSYAASFYGVHWINALAARLAVGHWVVVADADELLVYPGCEDLPLSALAARLDAERSTAVFGFMLDMYGSGPIRNTEYTPGTPFLDACSYFDRDSYRYRPMPWLTPGGWRMMRMRGWRKLGPRIPVSGGVRQRLFWRGAARHLGERPPFLPKVPLLRWSDKVALLASTHRVQSVRLARSTCVLLHFKLFADFAATAAAEVERGEHWKGASEYSIYARAMAAEPDLDPMYEGSVRYVDSAQLVDLGLMLDD